MDKAQETRLKLARIVLEAESDEHYAEALRKDPAAILALYGIPVAAVEEFSEAVAAERTSGFDPTECIHTVGCNDFTCIISLCPATCHLTIHLLAPDA